MKLSAKSDYAARAIIGLARRFQAGGAAVRVDDLASEQSIPAKFLVQILIELKSRGIVKSLRGKDGGYLLAKQPVSITLGDVLRCFHGQMLETPALTDPQTPAVLKSAWKCLQRNLQESADNINFQDLLDASEREKAMYYI